LYLAIRRRVLGKSLKQENEFAIVIVDTAKGILACLLRCEKISRSFVRLLIKLVIYCPGCRDCLECFFCQAFATDFKGNAITGTSFSETARCYKKHQQKAQDKKVDSISFSSFVTPFNSAFSSSSFSN
jgi:hypothetical protein